MAPFGVNLVICFIMGLAAGGLLPIVYALLTETIPARQRGPVIVLTAGVGTAAGFLVTSWLAHWLMPTFGWRIMWFIGLPTGLLLLALQRYIPGRTPQSLIPRGNGQRTSRSAREETAAWPLKPPGTSQKTSSTPFWRGCRTSG